jgi:hypothetical protein
MGIPATIDKEDSGFGIQASRVALAPGWIQASRVAGTDSKRIGPPGWGRHFAAARFPVFGCSLAIRKSWRPGGAAAVALVRNWNTNRR